MGTETAVLGINALNNIVWGIFAVFGIVGALVGLANGLVRSGIKLASIILAIVVAFSVLPTVTAKAYEVLLPYLDDALSSFAELFTASPTLKEYLPTLVMGLASPLIFVAVFALCLLAVAIIRGIINAIFKATLHKKPKSLSRLGGLALGAVAGVMVALCFVFPITGYFNAVPTIYTNVQEIVSTEENPIAPEVEEVIINLPNASAVKFVNNVTKQYFDQLVSYTDNETQISTLDDLTTITSLVPPAMSFVNSVGSISTVDDQSLRNIGTILEDNDKLRVIATEIANYASKKWLNDETFMGYNLREKFAPEDKIVLEVLDSMLADLASCTPDTIVEVLNRIANSLQTVREVFG